LASTTAVFRAVADFGSVIAQAGQVRGALSGVAGQTQTLGAQMGSLGKSATFGVTLPILGLGAAAVHSFADFETAITSAGIKTNATKAELTAMADEAKKWAGTTKFSAVEVADALDQLGALGLNAREAMGALPAALQAAQASGSDLATTTRVMATSMNAFGLEAKDTGHVADVLAVAANTSALSMDGLGLSLADAAQLGPLANASLEEVVAAIAQVTNMGVPAAQAGTAVRQAIVSLAAPATAKAANLMKELGIQTRDAHGNFLPLTDVLKNLDTSLTEGTPAFDAYARSQGMSASAAKDNALNVLFGVQGMKAMELLLSSDNKLMLDQAKDTAQLSQLHAGLAKVMGKDEAEAWIAAHTAQGVFTASGPDAVLALKGIENGADGVSQKAADMFQATTTQKLDNFRNSVQNLGIDLVQSVGPALNGIIDALTTMFGWLDKLIKIPGFGPLLAGVLIFLAALGPVLVILSKIIAAWRTVRSIGKGGVRVTTPGGGTGGGGGGGLGGAVSVTGAVDVFWTHAMPVYITNQGAGGARNASPTGTPPAGRGAAPTVGPGAPRLTGTGPLGATTVPRGALPPVPPRGAPIPVEVVGGRGTPTPTPRPAPTPAPAPRGGVLSRLRGRMADETGSTTAGAAVRRGGGMLAGGVAGAAIGVGAGVAMGQSPGEAAKNVAVYTALGAAAGVAESALGKMLNKLPGIAKALGTGAASGGKFVIQLGKMAAGGIVSGIGALATGVKAVAGAFRALGLALLANPVVLIIIAIIAVIALLVYLVIKYWDQIKAALKAAWDWIKSTAETVWNAIKDFFTGIWEAVKKAWDDTWKAIGDALQTAWDWIKDHARIFIGILVAIILGPIGILVGLIIIFWDQIKAALAAAWDWIKSTAETVWNAITSFFSMIWGGVVTAWNVVWEGIKTGLSTAWQWIKDTAASIWAGITGFFSTVWDGAKNVAITVWNAITTALSTAWNWIKSTAASIWNGITSAISTAINAVKSVISGALSGIQSIWNTVWNTLSSVVSTVFGTIKRVIGGAVDWVVDKVKAIWGAIQGVGGWIADHIPGMSTGGFVVGGRAGKDSVLRMLEPGEFVVTTAGVKTLGAQNLLDANSGMLDPAKLLGGVPGGVGLGGRVGPGAAGAMKPVSVSAHAGNTITINNPVPEPATESLPRVVRNLEFVGALG
jgi:TP901 family phage tail tape measure protein